jgi:hypothetical protein
MGMMRLSRVDISRVQDPGVRIQDDLTLRAWRRRRRKKEEISQVKRI